MHEAVRFALRSRLKSTRWTGLPVSRIDGIDSIQNQLARYDKRPFSITTGLAALTADNPNYDVVVRLPLNPADQEIPVGIVSKTYKLIQHRDVLTCVREALRTNGISSCEASLYTTALGERINLTLTLPKEYEFDPGDGFPLALQVRCINSVDGSTRFMLVIGWLRFVCSNGLIVGTTTTRIRQIHSGSFGLEDTSAAVKAGLLLAIEDRQCFTKWLRRRLKQERLVSWADDHVRNAWGVKAATRALHIVLTGHDVELKPFETGLPSRRTVRPGLAVPGMIPGALNAYAASQALSWLASGRNDHQERLDWTMQIPGLMERLLN